SSTLSEMLQCNFNNMSLLRNARIVLPDRIIESADLLTDGDRIARGISPDSRESVAAQSVVDLQGLTLFPGFIDVHIHGAAGIDTMAASAEDLRRVGEFLARHGVTSWLPTLVPAPVEQYERALRAIEQAMGVGAAGVESQHPNDQARVLGVHYEGPFVSSAQCGALRKEHFRTFGSVADIDDLLTLAPEVEDGIALIEELTKRNWIVSIGHTRADRNVLDRARDAGASHMTHFMNAMTPLHHRDIGAVG